MFFIFAETIISGFCFFKKRLGTASKQLRELHFQGFVNSLVRLTMVNLTGTQALYSVNFHSHNKNSLLKFKQVCKNYQRQK